MTGAPRGRTSLARRMSTGAARPFKTYAAAVAMLVGDGGVWCGAVDLRHRRKLWGMVDRAWLERRRRYVTTSRTAAGRKWRRRRSRIRNRSGQDGTQIREYPRDRGQYAGGSDRQAGA